MRESLLWVLLPTGLSIKLKGKKSIYIESFSSDQISWCVRKSLLFDTFFAHLGYLDIPNKYRQNKRKEASMLASAADSASSHFWTKKQISFHKLQPPPPPPKKISEGQTASKSSPNFRGPERTRGPKGVEAPPREGHRYQGTPRWAPYR